MSEVKERRISAERKEMLVCGGIITAALGTAFSIPAYAIYEVSSQKITKLPKEYVEATASHKRQIAYEGESPKGKFVMEFIRPLTVRVTKVQKSYSKDTRQDFIFGNDCLKGTPYDVEEKFVEGKTEGFLEEGQVKGKIPGVQAALRVDAENLDHLMIEPSNPRFKPLVLKGLHGIALTGANPESQGILDGYGCDAGQITNS